MINIAGSFILGGVAGAPMLTNTPQATSKPAPVVGALSSRAKLFWGTGFCGSFTTFSLYSVDVALWIKDGKIAKAIAYILVSNVGGVLAAVLGLALIRILAS